MAIGLAVSMMEQPAIVGAQAGYGDRDAGGFSFDHRATLAGMGNGLSTGHRMSWETGPSRP